MGRRGRGVCWVPRRTGHVVFEGLVGMGRKVGWHWGTEVLACITVITDWSVVVQMLLCRGWIRGGRGLLLVVLIHSSIRSLS